MEIKRIITGFLRENCYIVIKNNKALIIDPGDEEQKIFAACQGLDVVEVLVTHHHFDHTGALKEVCQEYKIEENKRSDYFDYEIIKTPGHTRDSVSYYFPKEGIMFTGDFLFNDSIGRTDLPTGSEYDMQDSLELISKYPHDVIIYPGHGDSSTIGDEIIKYIKAQ